MTFWARVEFARDRVATELAVVPGSTVTVVKTLQEVLHVLPATDFLVLIDAPADEARAVVERIRQPGSTLRFMHFNSAGREGFDAAGIPAGISVSQARGALAPTVAEHVFALALTLRRQVPAALDAQARAQWTPAIAKGMRGLDGGTLLLVGAGHIGHEVAQRAKAFGMNLVAVSRTARTDSEIGPVHDLGALTELVPQADVIVLCIALGAETQRMFDRDRLALVRPDAILINVGRGGLIDSTALAEALEQGRLGGAGLDVTDPEPLPPGHRLWRAPNLVITPHVAGAGPSGEAGIAAAAVEHLRKALAAPLREKGEI